MYNRQSPSRESMQSPKRPSTSSRAGGLPSGSGGLAADQDFENQKLKVELDHHKNLLIGANEKLTILNVIKEDLEQHRDMLNNSEYAREDLQQHLDHAVNESQQIATVGAQKHDTIITDNNKLKTDLELADAKIADATSKQEAKFALVRDEHAKKVESLLKE